MKTIFLFLLIASPALAQPFSEARSYSHHLFLTDKACEEAQRGDMWFNCSQTIQFQPDGTATVVVTDIMNPATYEVNGAEVIVTSTEAVDMPEKLAFRLDRTGRNLVGEDGEVWELDQP